MKNLSIKGVRKGTLLLGRGRAGALKGRVISESEHQKGRAIPHVRYVRDTHLFQNFLMRIFVMLLSIFLTD